MLEAGGGRGPRSGRGACYCLGAVGGSRGNHGFALLGGVE